MDVRMKAWYEIVARAWADDDYRVRLLAGPPAALREAGLEVPDGMTISVVCESSPNHRTLVLPPKPEGVEIVDADTLAISSFPTIL